MTVAPLCRINSASSFPSLATSSDAITTLAPDVSGSHISKPKMSKDKCRDRQQLYLAHLCPVRCSHGVEKIDHRSMVDLNALGLAAGSGSKHHIRQVLRIHLAVKILP
jgi:hypothetical protein